jgi:hypothetical protein
VPARPKPEAEEAPEKPEEAAAEPAEKREFDAASITKYNCGEYYGKCMGKICFAKETGRCACGNPAAGKFAEADAKCGYITAACPAQAGDIVRNYVRAASNDCKSYVFEHDEGGKSTTSRLAELVSCMKPKCRAGRTEDFVACFDEDNMRLKLAECAPVYEEERNLGILLEMFESSMAGYKKKYCDEIFGVMEGGECVLTIGIGVTAKAIKQSMKFRIGDTVKCSSANFGADLGSMDDLMKKKSIRNLAVTGVKLVGTGFSTASRIAESKVQSVSSAGNIMESESTTGLIVTEGILEGLSKVAQNTGDIIVLAMEGRKYSGACYALKDGGSQAKELFPEDDEVYYRLRWTDSWSQTMCEEGFECN